MKIKNYKPIAFSLLMMGLVCVIGYTIAYYTSSDTFNNEFNAGTYKMVVQERFESPDNWMPGDTTPKTVTATNKGSTPAAVRIKLTPSWTDKSGNPLELVDDEDNEVALINFANNWEGNWIYSNGYYYYNGSLGTDEMAPSLISSVTFNPEANIDSEKTCVEDPSTHKTKCTTRAVGYAGGTYQLTIDIETVQFDKYQEVWGTTIDIDESVTEPQKLYELIQAKSKMDNTSSKYVSSSSGINYSQKASDTNGKGVYTISSTANNDHPIMFYRGDVKNNYLTFADQCWRIVRTTDTGGTKIVYNGNAVLYRDGLDFEDYTVITNRNNDMEFNPITKSWEYVSTKGDYQEISFKVPEGDNYVITAQVGTYGNPGISGSGGSINIYKNGQTVGTTGGGGGSFLVVNYDAGHLTSDDEIMFRFYGTGYEGNPAKMYVQVYHSGDTVSQTCGGAMEYLFHRAYYTNYDFSIWSPDSISYMNGKIYELESGNSNHHSSEYFGTDATYQNGKYKLVDPVLGRNETHLYSCYSTDQNGECTILYYYPSEYWCIKFKDGDTMNTIYYNINDSTLKDRIDFIYSTYITNYTNYLEDTIYCNDRSGNLSLSTVYNANARLYNGTPSLACSKNDSFTVSNSLGNQALTYPTGTLTVDELMYAGLTQNDNNPNNYLNIKAPYWTMTPKSYSKDSYGHIFIVDANGKISDETSNRYTNYTRAVVSLKPDTMIIGGNGTISNPYRVAQ